MKAYRSVLIFSMLVTATGALSQTRTGLTMNGLQVLADSRDLRSDIINFYEKSKSSRLLIAGDLGNDISTVVIKRISLGEDFTTAESVLRKSGFTVSSRPGRTIDSTRIDRFDVYASSTSLIPSDLFGETNEVVIQLRPDNPDAYLKVGSVEAHIYIRAL